MQISFFIHYETTWGQRVVITGSIAGLGQGDLFKALILKHLGEGYWQGTLEIKRPVDFQYRYFLVDDALNILDSDWGEMRTVQSPKEDNHTVHIRDTWRAKLHPENFLFTSAFSQVIFKPGMFRTKTSSSSSKRSVTFRIRAPRVEEEHQVFLLGNIPELGKWDLSRRLLLDNSNHPIWSVTIDLDSETLIEYKYGLYYAGEHRVIGLETGSNRTIDPESIPEDTGQLIVTDEYFQHGKNHWKGTGIAVPVFSLRSENGFGAGEFNDIKLMADWSQKMGIQLIQILPINDTTAKHTWMDSYPYSAISVYALHPLYLNMNQIPGFDRYVDQKKFNRERKRLNALEKIDYEAVMRQKLMYAKQIFAGTRESLESDQAFGSFVEKNRHWLKPYALFCVLRDQYGTADFNAWTDHKEYSERLLRTMTAPGSDHFDEILFHCFVQYHLDLQLSEATRYAREKGIVFKGDLPIGIYRYSVDAWVDPHLFNMDRQAGAPPDPFSETGQNWGFPTYRWDEMAKDSYAWWKGRLNQLDRYFDAFRIDHILGFFRIWEIPIDQIEGTMGYFNPAIPVKLEEFKERNIEFQYDRFCKPYITGQILDELFDEETSFVVNNFLVKRNTDRYDFKDSLNTQAAIEQFFALPRNQDRTLSLKEKLFQIVSNVLLFEIPGSEGKEFHPRIDLKKTTSFRELDTVTQKNLEALYIDYFYVRQDDFWRDNAMSKLPELINATDMLICGEDLGMVPHCVPEVMHELGLLSLEIQRMSKNPMTEFLRESDIPNLSVCSPSTHDMAPIRAWWEESDQEQIQRFYNKELKLEGEAPVTCEPAIVEKIFTQHLGWPSMWAVFSVQDILGISAELRAKDPFSERINVPKNPRNYWQYRMHLTLERLLEEDAFNNKIRDLIERWGRG